MTLARTYITKAGMMLAAIFGITSKVFLLPTLHRWSMGEEVGGVSKKVKSTVCPYGGASCFECPLPDCELTTRKGVCGSNYRAVNMTDYEISQWGNDIAKDYPTSRREEHFFERIRHFELGNL